jgi:hypothetical protein
MRIVSHSVSADLQNLLTEYTNLANKFREKSPQFINDVEAWLLKAEAVFKKHNFPDTSKFGRLSSAVSATRRGYLLGEKNRNPRGEKQFLCWQFLNDGQDVVHLYLLKEVDKLEKAESLLSQLIVIAFQKKILDSEFLKGNKGNETAQTWQKLAQEQDFSSGVLQLKLMISQIDILILLDKINDKLKD